MQNKPDPYAVPKSMGIFKMLESPKDITTTSVAQRIIANHDIYVVFPFPIYFFCYSCVVASDVALHHLFSLYN